MRPKRTKIVRPTNEEIINMYISWLYDQVFPVKRKKEEYWYLFVKLFNITFYWSVPNDDNRGYDGLQLRSDWSLANFGFITTDWIDKECTVLEMLVALAFRMEDVLENPDRPSRVRDWFILLISNLGLKECTDENYSPTNELLIEKNIDKMLSRKYDREGNGGLFPIDTSVQDQRKVEIWYQMMKYINDSFDI